MNWRHITHVERGRSTYALSIVATPAPTETTNCVIATVKPGTGGANTFEIFLDIPGSTCEAVDSEVMFQVTGRHLNP